MGLNANMSSVFSWNTKQIFLFLQAEYESEGSTRNQVSLWDRIIERPEDAVLNLPHVRNKYRLIDKGADLRGRAFNLTLTWNVMNKVGGTYFDSVTSSGHTLPTEYDAAPGAPRQRGGGMGARARRGHAGVRI
jgi:signal peptidase complex subunit 3